MTADRTLEIPRWGDSPPAGRSFDDEMAPVMWSRTRLILLTGLAASVVFFLVNRWYGVPPVVPLAEPVKSALFLIHPLSFAVGLLLVHRGERTLSRVQSIAFFTVALNLLLLVPVLAILYPAKEPFLPLGMMMFTTAAFLPCRDAQTWLAGEAVALALLAELAFPALFRDVGAYWAGLPPRVAFFEHLWRVLGTVMIAVVSVLVSRSLYRLQRTAHQARRLGNYVIERELGAGGMGKVFVARHALICRPTAVKVLATSVGDPVTGVARFEREVQLSAQLTHPNTITIFDFGRTADDTFYYAMEYLDGVDLERLVEVHGPLPAERAVYLLRQILGSLGEAHARGIIHRDVKPSNIFVTQRGGLYDFVKVLDFGLAREVQTGGDGSLTKTGMVFGTPRYIAPESVSGQGGSDARSDLYNVGGVAYWMLTGRPLFSGSTSLDLIIDHVKTIPKPPSAVTELEIPPALDALVMKCLEKDPAARYQTAGELLAALRDLRLEPRWTQDRAREWWDLHAPGVAVTTGCNPPVGS